MGSQSFSDSNLSTVLGGEGSPKQNYVRFLLYLCSRYFDIMCNSHASEFNIIGGTSALIAFVPEEEQQRAFLREYADLLKQEDMSQVAASTLIVGKITVYLNKVLEFTERSNGGVL